jgi:hypothetical protein
MTKNKRSGNGRAQKASKARVATIVKEVLDSRIETKAIVGDFGGATSATGAVVLMSGLLQDDTVFGRTGNLIRVKPFRIRLSSKISSSTSTVRYIIFQDTMNQGVLPAVNDVLASSTYQSQLDYLTSQQKRFKILLDTNHDLTLAGVGFRTTHHWIRPIPELHYTASAVTQAAVGKNSLYSLVISESNITVYDISYTLRYTDA